jgi:DNA-binding transcriptional LysR family regulator
MAVKALAPKHRGGEWEESAVATAALLAAERALAAFKNEEYAVPFGYSVQWCDIDPLLDLRRELGERAVVQVLTDWDMPPRRVHAYFPQGRATRTAARAFIDFLSNEDRN